VPGHYAGRKELMENDGKRLLNGVVTGAARIDHLVKNKTPKMVRQEYREIRHGTWHKRLSESIETC